jgi:hypothetical protein
MELFQVEQHCYSAIRSSVARERLLAVGLLDDGGELHRATEPDENSEKRENRRRGGML